MSVDLDDIRNLVEKANEQVALDSQGTKLYLPENDHRRKVKKINPKFCQPWNQLELDLRANRVIEFISRYSTQYDITVPTSKKVKKLLAKALIQGHLTVDYDDVVGVIKSIPDLKYTHENGYYIDNDNSLICRVSKIQECPDAKTIVTEDFSETSSSPSKQESPIVTQTKSPPPETPPPETPPPETPPPETPPPETPPPETPPPETPPPETPPPETPKPKKKLIFKKKV